VGVTFHNSLYGPEGEEEWEVGNEFRDVSDESRDWNDKLNPGNMNNGMPNGMPPRLILQELRRHPQELNHPTWTTEKRLAWKSSVVEGVGTFTFMGAGVLQSMGD